MAWIPLVLAGIQAAGAASNAYQGAQKKTVQTPAPPSGGGTQMNPIGDLLTQLGGQDPGAQQAPPNPVQTPQAVPQEVQQPPTPSLPTTQNQQNDTAGGNKDMAKRQEIGDMLQSIPEALAAASDLLGFNKENRKTPAPTAGGTPMNPYANSFGALPRPPTLGEILAALPRPGGR